MPPVRPAASAASPVNCLPKRSIFARYERPPRPADEWSGPVSGRPVGPVASQLTKAIARYGRIDLLCMDELGYMELDRRGAELLFQVLTESEGKNSVAIASNESFSKAHMFRRTCAGPFTQELCRFHTD